MGRVQERLAGLLEGARLGDPLGLGLALLQLGDHLRQNLGVLQQVILHDLADRLTLLIVEDRILGHGGRTDGQQRRRRPRPGRI